MTLSSCANRYPGIVAAMMLIFIATSLRADPGTPDDRHALFDDLIEKITAREAWSSAKVNRLDINFPTDMESLRKEFIAADTDLKLYRAIAKLSASRRDHHLFVNPTSGGIQFPSEKFEAPLRFAPDFSASDDKLAFFLECVAVDFEAGDSLEPGDRLIGIDGQPVEDYLNQIDPFMRYSTEHARRVEYARHITRQANWHEWSTDERSVTYALQRSDGSTYYLSVPCKPVGDYDWPQTPGRNFPGFHKTFDTQSYTLYLPDDNRPVVLLDWHGFKRDLHQDIHKLVDYAAGHGLLDHDVIIDATHSRGGSRSEHVLMHLTNNSFKTTFGDLRVSDLLQRFIDDRRAKMGSDSPLVEWLETDVRRAAAEGQTYAKPVPFKLRSLPKDSDGILMPASLHFRGRLVCLPGPKGGSQLDQFIAMIVDNKLGHTIGMPTAGYSNTWEWEEEVVFPTTGRPVTKFMWTIGRTIRPNGEFLDGNPAMPAEYVPLTRDNFRTYYDDLLMRALQYLETD